MTSANTLGSVVQYSDMSRDQQRLLVASFRQVIQEATDQNRPVNTVAQRIFSLRVFFGTYFADDDRYGWARKPITAYGSDKIGLIRIAGEEVQSLRFPTQKYNLPAFENEEQLVAATRDIGWALDFDASNMQGYVEAFVGMPRAERAKTWLIEALSMGLEKSPSILIDMRD